MLVLAFSLISACVPMADYEAVVAENGKLSARVEKLDAKIAKQVQQIKDLQEELKPLIDRGILRIEVNDGRVTLAMNSDVLFASGSAALSSDGRETVSLLARALSRRTPNTDFQVEGHTDSDPINTPEFPNNWYLGAARGIVVTEAMIAAGFPRANISAASYADVRPVGNNNSTSGQAVNRRIEVVLVPDLSELPGYNKLINASEGKTESSTKKSKKKS